ncbi:MULTISPECIES: class I SAM-dependent methyltransferase [unclassified Rhizobium]|uniref:class I SAM-dependent methyltransferase n=1 Tax=unclassified Rhizobium TaxID=2613769 RepID=UPI000BD12F75|nr:MULTISPECIES: class I SAM-dependent methyltransferase [unclassified Rhizobium]MDH7808120.1 SAM-dependent methyltransferase [Rhizobium sp. AN67]MDQ4405096.1 class I SAM-dependent methyltransferase [Rhizobium sp. AN63]SOD52068.1 hypothetical protein SAMN05216595_0991 [Rhizobium sp. AN6A]
MANNNRDGGFEDFRQMAKDSSLSKYEKIGFPDSYRAGFETAIFDDIATKLSGLERSGAKILDIGAGCSDLPLMIIERGRELSQTTYMIDSAEMLGLLPEASHVHKLPGAFPNMSEFVQEHTGSFDAILCYSVFQYIFVEMPLYKFLDTALSLLAPGGKMLIGDIPNISKRRRFFASEAGREYHRKFTGSATEPDIAFNRIEFDKIDDAVILSIIARARAQGFDAFVMPQDPRLPMENRREDVLIARP